MCSASSVPVAWCDRRTRRAGSSRSCAAAGVGSRAWRVGSARPRAGWGRSTPGSTRLPRLRSCSARATSRPPTEPASSPDRLHQGAAGARLIDDALDKAVGGSEQLGQGLERGARRLPEARPRARISEGQGQPRGGLGRAADRVEPEDERRQPARPARSRSASDRGHQCRAEGRRQHDGRQVGPPLLAAAGRAAERLHGGQQHQPGHGRDGRPELPRARRRDRPGCAQRQHRGRQRPRPGSSQQEAGPDPRQVQTEAPEAARGDEDAERGVGLPHRRAQQDLGHRRSASGPGAAARRRRRSARRAASIS